MSNFFAGRIKEERKRLGFIQDEMAKIAGVSKHSLVDYENENRTVFPNIAFLAAIAAAGADINYIITGVRSVKGEHSIDLQEYPEIGTVMIFNVLLYLEKWLDEQKKSIPPDKKIELIKVVCRILAKEGRKRLHEKAESNSNVINIEDIKGFFVVATS